MPVDLSVLTYQYRLDFGHAGPGSQPSTVIGPGNPANGPLDMAQAIAMV